MADHICDIAVFGSDLVAAALAGVLARQHGRSVCLVADRAERHRLARGFMLSVAPLTRPESWAFLAAAVPETERLVAEIAGGRALERIAPVFVVRGLDGKDLLGHVRHLAAGFGVPAQRAVEPWVPEGAAALRFADALRIRRLALRRGVEDWLAKAGARVLDWTGLDITIGEDGATTIAGGGETITAGRAVLADDDAILALADPGTVAHHLHRRVATSILTEPAPPLPAPLMLWPEYGLAAHQRQSGAVEIAVPAAPDAALDLVARNLPTPAPLRRAGLATSARLATSDGAPLAGAARPDGPTMIAGFEGLGLFAVPALARLVAGTMAGPEAGWLAARAPGEDGFRPAVADFRPVPAGVAA